MKPHISSPRKFWSIALASLAVLIHGVFTSFAEFSEEAPDQVLASLPELVMLLQISAVFLGILLAASLMVSLIFGGLRERLDSVGHFFRYFFETTTFFFFVLVVFLAIQTILEWLPLMIWRGVNSAFCEGEARCMPRWIGDHFWWKCFLVAIFPYLAWVIWSAKQTVASPQRPARSKTSNRIGLLFVALVSMAPVGGFILLSYAVGHPPPGPAMPPEIPHLIDRIETI